MSLCGVYDPWRSAVALNTCCKGVETLWNSSKPLDLRSPLHSKKLLLTVQGCKQKQKAFQSRTSNPQRKSNEGPFSFATSRRHSRDVRTNAVGEQTYWITVATAVGAVVLTGGSGILAGLLLQYKLGQDAKREVERLKQEAISKGIEDVDAYVWEETQKACGEFIEKVDGEVIEKARNRPVRSE